MLKQFRIISLLVWISTELLSFPFSLCPLMLPVTLPISTLSNPVLKDSRYPSFTHPRESVLAFNLRYAVLL